MKFKLAITVLSMSFLLAACGGGGDESGQEPAQTAGEGSVDTAEAEELYLQSCASCHGQNFQGGAGPSLENIGGKYDHDQIESIILNGRGNMPKGILQGEDATVVAQWLSEMK
ncbi:c-type cytochrome [Bacillus lacus]|uniref:C-type cytochrome n=1 Tax=Metabacillus lacus TaxID=1983721 RepID=A0A7X2IYM5_9BACI|nr:cytochrome c [Metabacillus lacus]MRX72211.1 c-type cytochrome [Metabacillus lacus]